VREAASLGADLGCTVDEFRPTGLERAPNIWSFFFSELAVPFTREAIAGRESEAHWTGTEFYDKLKDKPEPTGRQIVENLSARDAIRRRILEQMADVPRPHAHLRSRPSPSPAPVSHQTADTRLFQAMRPPGELVLPALTPLPFNRRKGLQEFS
jgi:hypothetical protein